MKANRIKWKEAMCQNYFFANNYANDNNIENILLWDSLENDEESTDNRISTDAKLDKKSHNEKTDQSIKDIEHKDKKQESEESEPIKFSEKCVEDNKVESYDYFGQSQNSNENLESINNEYVYMERKKNENVDTDKLKITIEGNNFDKQYKDEIGDNNIKVIVNEKSDKYAKKFKKRNKEKDKNKNRKLGNNPEREKNIKPSKLCRNDIGKEQEVSVEFPRFKTHQSIVVSVADKKSIQKFKISSLLQISEISEKRYGYF